MMRPQFFPDLTLTALQNPDACLTDVDSVHATKYHVVLMKSKQEKLAAAQQNDEGSSFRRFDNRTFYPE